jgi:stage II sporulation protein E
MGSGRGAAVESRMVVSMFRKLITSGVNYSSAIKLINSIMLTKSREESFATLDAVRIDPDSGTLTVIKSGAAATLIRHGDKVMKISSPTCPIGIVEEAESFSETYDFDENDIIIMFSDGINENEYRFIKELLMCSSDIKSIVDEICAKAELFNSNIRQDDVTVIGVKINKSDNT